MTVRDPYPQSKFAIDGQDIVVDGLENSISFMIGVSGSGIIVNETYNYDNDGQVVIRGISDLMAKCVYGELTTGRQVNAKKTVDFYINDEVLFTRGIYASRLHNPFDPNGQKYVMAVASRRICYPGHPFYVTAIGQHEVKLYHPNGSLITTVTAGAPSSEGGAVYTTDYDPAVLFPNHYQQAAYMEIRDPRLLFPNHWDKAARMIIGDELEVDLLPEACREAVSVRFLNRYDVMESVIAHYMTEKPAVQDDVSMMGGKRTRFSVKSNTDYTLFSGKLIFQEEFDTWQDLLASRKAQILMHGLWQDIIITKSNYTRQRRQFYSSQVELTFQTAKTSMLL